MFSVGQNVFSLRSAFDLSFMGKYTVLNVRNKEILIEDDVGDYIYYRMDGFSPVKGIQPNGERYV